MGHPNILGDVSFLITIQLLKCNSAGIASRAKRGNPYFVLGVILSGAKDLCFIPLLPEEGLEEAGEILYCDHDAT